MLPPPPSASRSPQHGSPTKDPGKKLRRDDDEEGEEETYQDRHDTTAQSGSGSSTLPPPPSAPIQRIARSGKRSSSSMLPHPINESLDPVQSQVLQCFHHHHQVHYVPRSMGHLQSIQARNADDTTTRRMTIPESACHDCAMSSAAGDVEYNSCQIMLMSTFCRLGHKPHESMGLLSSFTLEPTSLCVSVIEALRRSTFQTSSNHLCALNPGTGNFISVYILLPSKTQWTAGSSSHQSPLTMAAT